MLNSRKTLFYSIVISGAITFPYCSADDMGAKFGNALKDGLKEASKELSQFGAAFGSDAAQKFGNSVNETGSKLATAIEGASKALDEASDKVQTAGADIRTVLVVGGAAVGVYFVARDAVGYFCPSDEQKNRRLRLEEEFQLRTAKKEFADCFAKNRTYNSLTIPKPCEALAGMIALSSSYEEVAKILQN